MAEKKKKDKKWIQKAVKNPGSFTAKAKKRGITSAQLQANVEANPDRYDETTRKQAQLRETLVKLNKKKKAKK
tara:strand:- start:565 stop:783 length:219 start_codon:yes stop_codon:yes gene_type:complete